ncbi:MAG: hypothetical protein H7A25_07055 [Leptospiraceae bacterium]|nr:hypothetical protein [Leptospiraceae bacterium]MCP5499641.1 hypothetical protein [Leptospiraceae bacterium]
MRYNWIFILFFGLAGLLAVPGNKTSIPSAKLPEELSDTPVPNQEEEILLFDRLTIFKNPSRIPDFFARGYIPRSAEYVYSTRYRGSFYPDAEISFAYRTSLGIDDLLLFYETLSKEKELRVLQKEKKENSHIILLETLSRRIITIQISEQQNSRFVFLFYKNQF